MKNRPLMHELYALLCERFLFDIGIGKLIEKKKTPKLGNTTE